MKENVKSISLDKLKPNPYNTNWMPLEKYLALKKDISNRKAKGLDLFTDDFVLIPLPYGNFEIVDGEHRTKICKELGISAIPNKHIKIMKLSDLELKEIMRSKALKGIENPIKKASLFHDLKKKGETVYQISKFYFMSESNVRNYLRLLSGLNPKIIAEEKEGKSLHVNFSFRACMRLIKYKKYPNIQYALYKKLCNDEQFSITKYANDDLTLISELVRKYKISVKELSKFYHIPIKRMKLIVNNATGVQPIPIEEMERKIKEQKEKQEKEKKEEKAQTTLDAVEVLQKTKKTLETIEEKIKALTPAKIKFFKDITKRKHYENLGLANKERLIDFINNASLKHVRELSNLIKHKQYPDIVYRNKIVKDTEHKVATITLPKSLYEDAKQYCDLEKYSLNDFIVFSLIRILENKKS